MVSTKLIRFENARLVNPATGELSTQPASVWISTNSGKIYHIQVSSSEAGDYGVDPTKISEDNRAALDHATRYDLNGATLSPGLIDIQINGCFGVDFSQWITDDHVGRTPEEAYQDGLEKVERDLAQTGVTSFVPTVIVSIIV